MISAAKTLPHLHISNTSVLQAVQDVRGLIISATAPLRAASELIMKITGIDRQYSDLELAITVAQHCAETAIRQDQFEPVDTVIAGEKRDQALRQRQPWLYAQPKAIAKDEQMAEVAEGIDVKVAVKADGSIKKGGKQTLSVEMYKKHVMEAAVPLNNQEFIALLMRELKMTKSGATTYAWNCKKQFSSV